MKERIDHNNYEAWLLDRMEGNLSPEQELELDAFLALHPEFAPSDDEFPSLVGIAAALSQEDKESLKRFVPPAGEVTPASLDDHLIARLEGDLTPEQKLALEKFLYEHPEHADTSRLYALTKLVPEAMAYAAKLELERHLPPQGKPDKYCLDDFLVARLEGDLAPEQEHALQAYLNAHPKAQREWAAMSAARIEAGQQAYPHKQRLKKGGKVISISFKRTVLRLAAAASVAVFIGVGAWTVWRQPALGPENIFVDNRLPAKEATEEPATRTQDGDQQGSSRVEESTTSQDGSRTSDPIIPDAPGDGPMLAAEPGTGRGSSRSTEPSSRERIAPASERAHDRDLPQFAEQRRIIPATSDLDRIPVHVAVAHVPVDLSAEYSTADQTSSGGTATVGAFVASAIREKVLDQPASEVRPLDVVDAFAMVDKSLKAISGENAGLDVQRTEGKTRSFSLRVGNFAVSGSTSN